MWKKILVAVAALLAIFLAVVASRPAAYRVERSALVAAPPWVVYERIADFRRWSEWSPWAHVDPEMKQSFEGAPSGLGAEYTWSGNSQIGEGRMAIVAARADELVAIRMDLVRPLRSTSTTELRLVPATGGVRVSWVMDGRRDFAGKAVALLVGMDARLGRDFEKGLADLKKVAEGEVARGAGR